MQGLTEEQKLFVSAYLKCHNGVQAAKEAGYKGNDHTLHQVAFENLRKPAIAEAVGKRQAKRNERLEIAEDFELQTLMSTLELVSGDVMDDGDEDVPPSVNEKKARLMMDIAMNIAKLRGKLISKVAVSSSDGVADMLERLRNEH